MNYENREISAIHELWKHELNFLKTWIMKIGKYLQYTNYENIKYLFSIHELWKH